MPEMPEVETIKKVLSRHIKGKIIENVKVNNEQVIATPSTEKFILLVKGKTISNFLRRGKFLKLQFTDKSYLVIHLRMTGCLTLESSKTPYEKHTHLLLILNDGNELRYVDTRRFGKIWFFKKENEDVSGITKLGIEPFSSKLTLEYLKSKCKKSKKCIKELLLNQQIIAGIGNIYSDEILFESQILPNKLGCNLLDEEYEKLVKVIPKVLDYFIKKNTISFEDYLLTKGKDYRNTPYLKVYGKSDSFCPKCYGLLKRMMINGRSSVYCPHCQK